MFRLGFFVAFSFALAAAADNTTSEDFQETVIFLRKQTRPGQNVFIRGGVGDGKDCAPNKDPEDDPCAIPIEHLELDMDSESPLRDQWADSDLFLSWGGNEDNQDLTADGTPAQWTTSDQSKDYYHGLNKYGEHYWMVHFDMDCSKLKDGFFDFKGYLDGRWEDDIRQSRCDGDVGGKPKYSSNNHVARCGYVNVFEWNTNSCTIDKF